MVVDYDKFAKTFSDSRKNMKWEEIDYFLSFLKDDNFDISILDVGCGNGRFLNFLKQRKRNTKNYLGIDLSNGLLNEARKIHNENNFLHLDMLDLHKINKQFDFIFFIASFHHLDSFKDRLEVLKKTYSLLKKSGKIFMTNWALDSNLNKKKYKKSIIENSKNDFGNFDYNIKIGEFYRFYHCFSLKELEYLFKISGFKILENRLFDNDKNYISILEKGVY